LIDCNNLEILTQHIGAKECNIVRMVKHSVYKDIIRGRTFSKGNNDEVGRRDAERIGNLLRQGYIQVNRVNTDAKLRIGGNELNCCGIDC